MRRPWLFAGAVFFAMIEPGMSPLRQQRPRAREAG
jgi:hypothetical protein